MSEENAAPQGGQNQKKNQRQEQARIVQTKKQGLMKKAFILSVAVPSLVAVVYFMFWATGMYVSTSSFAVKGENSGGSGGGVESFLSSGSDLTAQDSYVVENYIRSSDMLAILDEKFDLAAHYQNPDADFLSRLDAQATPDDFLAYWQSVISVTFDSTTGIIKLEVRTFTPEKAEQVAREIIRQSEKFINSMHLKPHKDTLALAESELSRAEKRLSSARMDIHAFQIEHGELSPQKTAESRMQMISQLEAERAKTRAEFRALSSYMQDSSQKIRELRHRITGLGQQIEFERERLIGGEVEELSAMVTDYKELFLEEEFAERQYEQALAAVEQARVMLEKQSGYAIPIQDPTLPQEPGYPKRIEYSLLSICAIFLGMGILFLVIAAVREHAGV